jgi:Trypsin
MNHFGHTKVERPGNRPSTARQHLRQPNALPRTRLVFFGAIAIGFQANAAETSPSRAAPPEYVSITQLLPAGQIKISGGFGAVPSEWRSIAIAKAGHITCTASLVGRSVILTSAHCVDGSPYDDQASIILGSVKFGDTVTPLTECKMHPDYAQARMAYPWPRHASDFALCTLKFPVSGVALETISATLLLDKAPVTLLGFGCTNLKIKNNRIDPSYDPPDNPVLRIGGQQIADLNAPIAGVGNGYALTISRQGSANLCPGDSGGPVLTGIASFKSVKSRQIAAVASAMHGKWGKDGQDAEFYSFLAPITNSVRAWIKSWGDVRGLSICGIHRLPGTDECRI